MSKQAPTRLTIALVTLALLTGCAQKPEVGAAQPTEPPPTPLTAPSFVNRIDAVPLSSASISPATPPSPTGTHPAYVFPIKTRKVSFGRAHHDYPATDIFAPCGSEAVAVIDGVVDEVSRKDTWTTRENEGATRGGLSVSIVGTDGVRYYGSHLRSVGADIVPGRRVQAGEMLGRVGRSGSARSTSCHLHFGISPPCAKRDWWNRRGVLSPYPFLTSWRAGGQRSPVKAVTNWRSDPGCPKKVPKS